MIRFVNEKKIVPNVDSIRRFEDILSALEIMKKGKQFGKLVVEFDKSKL